MSYTEKFGLVLIIVFSVLLFSNNTNMSKYSALSLFFFFLGWVLFCFGNDIDSWIQKKRNK